MVKVTINCDMGEAFSIYRFGDDEACMPFITHANVACGFHASDPVVMREDGARGQAPRRRHRRSSWPAGSRRFSVAAK